MLFIVWKCTLIRNFRNHLHRHPNQFRKHFSFFFSYWMHKLETTIEFVWKYSSIFNEYNYITWFVTMQCISIHTISSAILQYSQSISQISSSFFSTDAFFFQVNKRRWISPSVSSWVWWNWYGPKMVVYLIQNSVDFVRICLRPRMCHRKIPSHEIFVGVNFNFSNRFAICRQMLRWFRCKRNELICKQQSYTKSMALTANTTIFTATTTITTDNDYFRTQNNGNA